MKVKILILAAAVSLGPGLLHAQYDFKVADRDVQIHSFASQGFMYSNQNNYMSMPTSKGSFAFTDGGANISTQITDKFRVGAQIYVRNVGDLGNWRPAVDWAVGDYKFKPWFGVRAGRVKTALGLYNDIQDMDSLHVFALLPESIYPIDWRSSTIAHDGADVYGDVAVKHLGTISYTGYTGVRPQDPNSGYANAWKPLLVTYSRLGGHQTGGDLHVSLPFGAVVGASYLYQSITGSGTYDNHTGGVGPYALKSNEDNIAQFYGQYSFKNLRFDTEYRKNLRDYDLTNSFRSPVPTHSIVDQRGWYVSGTYRVSKRIEIGAYRSHFLTDARKATDLPTQHLFDTTVSARINLTARWYAKVEGKFFDGAPTSPSAARGFYTAANPTGILPTTNLLVFRTGISF